MTDGRTFLQFGKIKENNKITYDERYDQEAYDFFMFSRYMKDIMAYQTNQLDLIHHNTDVIDNLKKYAGLSVCKNFDGQSIFFEVGSSLMGVIDSLEYFNKKFKELDLKKIFFLGIDNSKLMNFGAKMLHKEYRIALFEKKENIHCDVYFAKGVSLLYVYNDEKEFCETLKNSRLAIFDYTFSLSEKDEEIIENGKKVTFLSLQKCKEILEFEGKSFILTESKRKHRTREGKKTYECIYGDSDIVEKYQNHLKLLESKYN